VECYSSSFEGSRVEAWNELVTGYVPTSLLTEKQVKTKYAFVVDKLDQRLYIYEDGVLLDVLAVSTGLVTEGKPYNETRSGEYILWSLTGAFADGETTCDRYEKLVAEYPIDVAFIGIGENGHIAFNDPHEAKFDDPQNVRIVTLDDVCRQQQVNDGCFPTINDVPKTAITLTIPAIMHAKTLVCTVPAKAKANAVKAACLGPVSEACPASIIRTHDDCVLFCDPDSGCYLG